MPQRITFEPSARRQLRAIDQDTALLILESLARYVFQHVGDVKQLQGFKPPQFRLRVGNYRLRFLQEADLIHVISVAHRREAYR